jgi:hypothetical protein
MCTGIVFVLPLGMKNLLWIMLAMLPAACAAPSHNVSGSADSQSLATPVCGPAQCSDAPACIETPVVVAGSQSAATTQPVVHMYAPATADALTFDPQAIMGTARVDLSRQDRRPSAFNSYEENTITTYDIYTDNRDSNDPDNVQVQRRTLIDQSGVQYR